jgi:hypothetical protein
MALKPVITRLDTHEYIIVNNVSSSLQEKKNSALKLVLNTFNFDEISFVYIEPLKYFWPLFEM